MMLPHQHGLLAQHETGEQGDAVMDSKRTVKTVQYDRKIRNDEECNMDKEVSEMHVLVLSFLKNHFRF